MYIKYKTRAIILVMFITLSGPGCDFFDTPLSGTKWTVLVHFAIDNNIDYFFETYYGFASNYLETLEAVKAADTDENIEIVVLMDGYNSNSEYQSKFRDGYYRLTGGDFHSDLAVDTGEINSGNVGDTERFMDWAVDNYPADRYIYSVFNHGSGFDDMNRDGSLGNNAGLYEEITGMLSEKKDPFSLKGIGFDNTSMDCLSHYELGLVTGYMKNKIGKPVDLFYPYACLMGGIELAYEVRNNVQYLLFSERLFPADYWSYNALQAIVDDPSISTEDVGRSFCDSAYDYFNGKRRFTLALVDLRWIEVLSLAVDDYARKALMDLGDDTEKAAVYNTCAEESVPVNDARYIFYYMDLGDYMKNIVESTEISNSVKASAHIVEMIMDTVVKYKQQDDYDRSSGISIFHNIWYSRYIYSVDRYRSILCFGKNTWSDYIEKMGELTRGDEYEPDNSFEEAGDITLNEESQARSFHRGDDEDYIKLDLSEAVPGTRVKIETYALLSQVFIFADTEIYLYDEDKNEIAHNQYYDMTYPLYSRIIFTCENPGVYFIRVKAEHGEPGDYLIDAVEFDRDSYEPDDGPAYANEIVVDAGYQNHNLHNETDTDWLYFNAEEGHTYTIECYHQHVIAGLLDIYLYDESDLSNEIADGLIYRPIVFDCTRTGKYYIMLKSTLGTFLNEYLVQVRE